MPWRCLGVAVVMVALAACDWGGGQRAGETDLVELRNDDSLVDEGRQVFSEHCARCHGRRAEGGADWRSPDASGQYPPPPLDGSGHAWHHSTEVLRRVIAEGSPDSGRMPAWSDRLSQRQIDAAIAWFQARWPEDIYRSWLEMQGQSTR